LGEDNLMLIYSNDMARIWDVRTQEFWRSMTRDKAEELLEQGGWFETFVLVISSWLKLINTTTGLWSQKDLCSLLLSWVVGSGRSRLMTVVGRSLR